MAIQAAGVGLLVLLMWTIVTGGIFSQGVSAFSGWYAEMIAPEFSMAGLVPNHEFGASIFVAEDAGALLRPAD